MQTISDSGCADTSIFSVMNINIRPWLITKASKTDYIANGAYNDRESSNGKKMGVFEFAQSRVPFVLNYRDIYAFDVYIDSLNLLIGKYQNLRSDAALTMFASERVLQKDWDSPEEDTAWANL